MPSSRRGDRGVRRAALTPPGREVGVLLGGYHVGTVKTDLMDLIDRLRTELRGLTSTGDANFTSWTARAQSALLAAFDEEHHLVRKLVRAPFYPRSTSYLTLMPDVAISRAFESGRRVADGVLDAALYELRNLPAAQPPASPPSLTSIESVINADLFSHVGQLITNEQWAQVASQTAIFVESQLRTWVGLTPDDFGVNLMTAIFKPQSGLLPLGRTDAERDGWHALARGFMGALSNVDRHNIQDRDDLQRYAMGVLGIGSLLLTQVLHEHGDDLNL